MKKILSFLLIIFIFVFAGIMNIRAASLSVSKSNLNPGNVFTLNYSDLPEGCILTYDNSFITMTNTNGFLHGSELVAGSGNISFQVNQVSLSEDKVLYIKIVKNDTGSEEVASVEITINANQKTPQPNTQNNEQTTTTQSTTTNQTPKSNNANLKSLEIKANDGSDVVLSPSFSSNVYEYEASVLGTVKTVNINATMEDNKANLVISNNANEELIAGENNKITITVTAEDGTKKSYVVNIRREALTADATLSMLSIEEVPDFKLKENVFKYTISVASNVNSLNISYSTNDREANVEITGNENLKDGSVIKLLITASDGTKKEYTITISKEKITSKKITKTNVPEEKNPLIIMALSIIAFGLVGSIVYTIKK